MIGKFGTLVGRENFFSLLVFVVALSVYHTTTCPTVSFTDSGELATVATILGIAHPTGYPLWTLINRLAVLIPVGSQEIVRLNVFAGIVTALAMAFFFKLVMILRRSPRVFGNNNDTPNDANPWLVLLGAFVSALTLGFSSTIWAQSVEIEVYALHALLLIITTMFFVGGIEEQLSDSHKYSPQLMFFSFVLGLSFANHLTTVLLAPGFLYLYFVSFGLNKKSWKIIAVLVPYFLLGLSAYCYLPVRSSCGTLLDWGHPVTLERFWRHVTGNQYQTWMFSGWDVVTKQLHYFITNFVTEFHWMAIALIVVGMIEAFNQSRRLLLFLLLLFATCVFYSINFDIHEIDPYFMLAYLVCGCFLGIAVQRAILWCSHQKSRMIIPASMVILLALPVLQVFNNRTDVDQSENFQAKDFVQSVFTQVKPNAVIFSSLWDYFVSPAYYYQVVRRERPDIILVDAELLQDRTWYFTQLQHDHPGFLDSSRASVDAFLLELTKFEKGEPFDFSTIKNRWEDLLQNLVSKSLVNRPVYVDSRIVPEFSRNFDVVPSGLLVLLTPKGHAGEWEPIRSKFEQGTFDNYVTSDLKRYYASMYTFHAYWLLTQNRGQEATENLQNALQVDPGFAPALNLKARITSRPG